MGDPLHLNEFPLSPDEGQQAETGKLRNTKDLEVAKLRRCWDAIG